MKLPSLRPSLRLARFRYGSQPRPARDWLVLLGAFLFLFVATIGYNLWLFTRVTNGGSLDAAPAAFETRTVDIRPALEVFEARVEEQERYLNEYRFVDPSR